MAVGITITDAAIGAVDQKLGALMAGDGAGLIDCGGLGRVNRCGALGALAADGPAALVRHNVLISLRHLDFLAPNRWQGYSCVMVGS